VCVVFKAWRRGWCLTIAAARGRGAPSGPRPARAAGAAHPAAPPRFLAMRSAGEQRNGLMAAWPATPVRRSGAGRPALWYGCGARASRAHLLYRCFAWPEVKRRRGYSHALQRGMPENTRMQ